MRVLRWVWRRLRLLLSAEKAPFLLPTLLAFSAWGVSHMADRLKQAPTLEYACKATGVSPFFGWECVARNLSTTMCFKALKVHLKFPQSSKGRVYSADCEWLGTTWSGHSVVEKAEKSEAAFFIDSLHPGQALRLTASVSGDSAVPEFRIESNQPVFAVKSNLATRAVRREQFLIVILIGGAFLLAGASIALMREETPPPKRLWYP